jgi:hypothetical protein
MPNPIDDPDLYDHVELGGVQSPGVVTIMGHDRKVGWDIKKGAGQSGATTTRSSDEPIEFTCSFKLVDADDFDAWPTFLATVNSTVSGQAPTALDIYHPDLAENGITAVVKATVMGTVHDGTGGVTKAVKFLEYRPPRPAKGSPKGSKAGADAKAPDPNQAALDEIARLTAEYQKTPWGRPAS